MITMRTERSASAARNKLNSSLRSSLLIALRFSGRLRVRRRMPGSGSSASTSPAVSLVTSVPPRWRCPDESSRTSASLPRLVYDLQLGELLDPPGPVLDSDAAPLEASERLLRRESQMGVDPGRATFQLSRDAASSVGVRAPDRPTQPEV